MADVSLQAFAKKYAALAAKRGLNARNPIKFELVNGSSSFVLIVSPIEPTFSELPYNVLWLDTNLSSVYNGQILRRTSHVTDGQHRSAWQLIDTYADLFAVPQFYKKVAEELSDFGMSSGDVAIPLATTTTMGIVQLHEAQADAIVVSDNDPRMADPRYPTAHDHDNTPRTLIRLNSTSHVKVSNSKAPEANSVLMLVGVDVDGYIGEWRVPEVADVVWQTPRLLNLRISLPGQASFMSDASTVVMAVSAEYEDRVDPDPTDVLWSIEPNAYNVTIDPNTGTVSAPDLELDLTLKVTAKKLDPVYLTWATDTYDLRIKNLTNVVTLDHITVTGPATMQAGTSVAYTVVAHFTDGSSTPVVGNLASSDPVALTLVGTIGTANKMSTDTDVTISAHYSSAEYGEFDATTVTKVLAYKVTALEIVGADTIQAGSSQGYLFTATFSNGDVKDVTPNVFSSDSNKITISGKTATAATVPYDTAVTLSASYTFEGITVSASKAVGIKYVAPELTPVSLVINGADSLNEGTSADYTVTVTLSDGSTETVTPLTFTSDQAALTVSGLRATAIEVTNDIQAVLTATYKRNGVTVSATKDVTIVDVLTFASLEIVGAASVVEGNSATYTVNATFSDGSVETVVPDSFTTNASAVLSLAGLVATAQEVGVDTQVVLTATYTALGKTLTVTKIVLVTNVVPTVVSLEILGAAAVDEQSTSTYTAVYHMSDSSTVAATNLTWSIVQGLAYAGIGSSTGIVNTNSVSAAQQILIKAINADGVYDTFEFTINNTITVMPTSIAITGPAQVSESAIQQYGAVVYFSDGTSRSLTSAEVGSWSVSAGGAYATIASTGILTTLAVTGDKTSTLSLSATVDGVTMTDTQDVIIKDTPVTVVGAVISGAATPAEATSEQYTVKIRMSDGSTVDPTSITAWSVTQGATKASINSIGLATYGMVSANTAATLSCTCVYGGQSYTATFNVTIVNTGNKVLSQALTGSATITEGQSATYSMTLTLEDASTVNVTAVTLAFVSGAAYATVLDQQVVANYVSADQTVVLQGACVYGGNTYTAQKTVTIKDVPVVLSSVAISGPASIAESTSQQYTATASFSDGSTLDVTATATWSISNNGGLASLTQTKGKLTAPAVTADTTVVLAVSYTSGSTTKTANISIKITNASSAYTPRFGIHTKIVALADYNEGFMEALTTTITGGAEDIVTIPGGSTTSANNKFAYVAYPAALGYAYVRQKDGGSYGFAGSWDGAMEFDDFNFAGAAEVYIGGILYYIYRTDWPMETNEFTFSFTYGSTNTLSGIA